MMTKKKISAIDAFLALPDEEKERQCKEFDKEYFFETGRPLTPAQRAMWERAKRRGRPRIGHGAKVISLSVERELLSNADARAKALGISRAELVARALRSLLARKNGKAKAA
jgi:hypothetical protein